MRVACTATFLFFFVFHYVCRHLPYLSSLCVSCVFVDFLFVSDYLVNMHINAHKKPWSKIIILFKTHGTNGNSYRNTKQLSTTYGKHLPTRKTVTVFMSKDMFISAQLSGIIISNTLTYCPNGILIPVA